MKTVKLLLVATMLVFTSANFSNAGGFERTKNNTFVKISLAKALSVPGLPAAMMQQLDEEELIGCGCATSYTAKVTHQGVNYLITGTEQEWAAFFNNVGILLDDKNNDYNL